jgi:ABC-type branched-subunit amino acid transport system substrate-binding protein
MPYSGPASAYGTIGKAEAAYFRKVNDEGGINGRKIVFTSLDDGYSPPKTVEMTRRLVEQDQALLLFGGLGTPQNTAVHAYLNSRKVPQLFVATGRASGTTRRVIRGRWAGSRTTRPRRRSTPGTSCRRARTRRSACSTRTTTTAVTI